MLPVTLCQICCSQAASAARASAVADKRHAAGWSTFSSPAELAMASSYPALPIHLSVILKDILELGEDARKFYISGPQKIKAVQGFLKDHTDYAALRCYDESVTFHMGNDHIFGSNSVSSVVAYYMDKLGSTLNGLRLSITSSCHGIGYYLEECLELDKPEGLKKTLKYLRKAHLQVAHIANDLAEKRVKIDDYLDILKTYTQESKTKKLGALSLKMKPIYDHQLEDIYTHMELNIESITGKIYFISQNCRREQDRL